MTKKSKLRSTYGETSKEETKNKYTIKETGEIKKSLRKEGLYSYKIKTLDCNNAEIMEMKSNFRKCANKSKGEFGEKVNGTKKS